ncbi:LuxR C-terminal-related transcriptional regulator [Nocardioides sp. C4-1]|uniref:LuxR C-terminal-related transcriptional regulator n=1 Tax=Nocardioides sp. C4-1 TaxID=3151851 RepID=UPI003265D7C3
MVAATPHDLEAPDDTRLDEARVLVRRGRIEAAVAELRQLHAVHPEHVDAAALLLECHLAQGDLGAALTLGTLLEHADTAAAHHARAELASAIGEPELAVERFLAAGRAHDVHGLDLAWRAGAALALIRIGRRAEALELARDQHALALATGSPDDVALALRVLATADPGTGVARLREGLALLTETDGPDRLRAQLQTDLAGLLVLGGATGEALALLRPAELYAGREGLWPLQSRVRRLLDRLGEAPHRAESETLSVLTAAERRVAVLVLDGLTNREVADRLVVSVKAVEGHLSKVYRKLGVGSRSALVASVGPRQA